MHIVLLVLKSYLILCGAVVGMFLYARLYIAALSHLQTVSASFSVSSVLPPLYAVPDPA